MKSDSPVLVLGGQHEIDDILHVFNDLDLPIAAHHEPIGHASSPLPYNIPRVDAVEFCRLAREHRVLVASHLVNDQSDAFLDACRYMRTELGIGARPIHPSALCDDYNFPPQRHLITGLASSGNIVFQRLLAEILAAEDEAPAPKRARVLDDRVGHRLASFSMHHLQSVRKLMSAHLGVPLETITASGTHLDFGQCLFQTSDRYCSISGLPLRHYAWAGEWTSSHEPVTKETISFYQRNGYGIIYILRHPLDVIVSLAAKISSVLPGQKRPELALGDRQWFSDVVATVAAYFEGLTHFRKDLHIIRYEGLFTNPADEIIRLAAAVGLSRSHETANALWRRLDNVPVAGEKHLWKPGMGKWKALLSGWHRDFVMRSSLPETAQMLGYEILSSDFGGSIEMNSTDVSAEYPQLVWIDAIFEIPIGKPVSLTGDLVRIENDDLGLVGFFSSDLVEAGRAFLASDDLRTLTVAARMDSDRPRPQTVKDLL